MKPLRIVFAGTPDFSCPALQAIIDSNHEVSAVYTQPDRPAGRGRKLTASPVKELALKNSLSVFQPKSLRNEVEQQKLKELNPDVMVVVAYGLILPQAILDIPKYGCFNIHASLLPRWRGAAPIHRAVLAGDPETGITIMQMDKGLDTGDMLWKQVCPITTNTTTQSLHDDLMVIGAKGIMSVLNDLPNVKPETQDESQATYADKLTKQEGRINWNQPASDIDRMVRAFNPYPVAHTQLQEQTIRIWEAQELEYNGNKSPGSVIAIDKQGIDVATKQGLLRITKLQFPGKKALTASDIANANLINSQNKFI